MTDAVLDAGARLADDAPGRLRVVHVVAPARWLDDSPYAYLPPVLEALDEARRWLTALVAGLPGAEPVVLQGRPAQTVCEWARRDPAVEVIVAAASRGVIERAVLGGFASHLVYHAPCAVHLVPPRVAAAAP
jgi:universal stress protein F